MRTTEALGKRMM